MASTIEDSTLTVTVTETININGIANNSENKYINTGTNEIFKRIVTCPASQDTTVFQFATGVYSAPGDLAVGDVKYFRITNKDDTNSCTVAYVTTNTNYQLKLGAGESQMFGATALLGFGDDDTTPLFPTLENLVKVIVDPAANAIDVEVFAASA
jgi:hypothetical protein